MAKAKHKLKAPKGFHFFASSIAEWKVSTDPATLINHFRREPFPFALFLVPVDIEAEYKIESFVPQVEGVKQIAFYELAK